MEWSEVPNLSITDGGQCVISAPPDGGQCTPLFLGFNECKLENGACFSSSVTSTNKPTKKEAHMALPAGFPAPVAPKVKAVVAAPVAAPVVPADMSQATAAPDVTQALSTVPSLPLPGAVGVPAVGGALGELGQLPHPSNISPLSIVLALVAVGGGGAAWKFYSQRSKEKHEEAMLKIEKGADSDSSEKLDQQRQKCDAAAQTAKEKIEGLSVRADATDKSVAELRETLDNKLTAIESKTEELDTKLSALERKLPAKKTPEKKPKGAAK